LRLLEKHVVLTEGLPDLDHTTIGRVLKKTSFVLIGKQVTVKRW
jgi:hypothetical protein